MKRQIDFYSALQAQDFSADSAEMRVLKAKMVRLRMANQFLQSNLRDLKLLHNRHLVLSAPVVPISVCALPV
jgi:hypothetical protein